jgi:hypothetical protein
MLVGLGLGGLLVMLMARGETRWNIISSLLERLQLPIAGFAPLSGPSLLSGRLAPPHLIESYRDLRTKLKQLPVKDCLLMTLMPLRDRDGLAEAVTNLACVLADGGGTVLVIDADFRNPGLHHFFAAANHPGLSDFLSGEIRLEETVIKTRRPNLWFMPSGPLHDDPAGLINGAPHGRSDLGHAEPVRIYSYRFSRYSPGLRRRSPRCSVRLYGGSDPLSRVLAFADTKSPNRNQVGIGSARCGFSNHECAECWLRGWVRPASSRTI